ncbi:MAG: putative ABC transporter substrate binding protein, partial [Candidatus Berkelbacteria bacterium Licking1014_96]
TNSSFASILSEVGILPEHKLREVKAELLDKNDFNFNPIGSGRYYFEPKESKQNGDEIVLKKADTYKKDSPGYFDKIIFRSYSSTSELIEAYKKGEINGFGGFNSADISAINRKTFRCFRLQIPRFTAIFLNLNKDNFKELKFRQALARAVDKEKIVQEVYGGEAEQLKTIIPSFAPGYDEAVQDYPYHLPTSTAYLDELKYIDSDNDGIREKDGQKLELTVYTTDDLSLQKMAELVSADWQAAGIGTKVMVIDLLSLQKTIIPSHNYDAIILGENLGYPPDPYPYFHSSQIEDGLNISVYKNLTVDSLLEDERLSIDLNVRTEKLESFSRIIAEDLPVIPLVSAPYLYGANVSVKGIPKVRIAQNSSDRFLEIGSWYIKSERKKK